MAKNKYSEVVLLSIKPEYAEEIRSGRKRIEFRKRAFAQDVKYVVVYATVPEKKIIGYFELDSIEQSPPDELWKKHHKTGGISESNYSEYYKDVEIAFGLLIREFKELQNPIDLDQLRIGLKAPQSYLYLQLNEFQKIQSMAS
jgi:predicted transcriptional regulator